MDQTITYDEVTGFLKNPPTMSPRPDFTKIRALRKHSMARALKQLVSPQSQIHGWSGLVISPMVYALLEPNPFQDPVYPGDVAVYPQFALPAVIKTADAIFARNQNEWKSYENIYCACFRMLDENVPDQYKVSNVPNLNGWNISMSIREMLDQLEASYGKPDTMTLFNNDTLFRSVFNPTDAPESLFYRIEQCQEIQVLARDPYSDLQVINNAVRLLMQASIFPLKEFEDWKAVTPKTYPALKVFIAGAYTRRLLTQKLRNTAGQMGYAPPSQNMYNVLQDDESTTDGTTATKGTAITNIAAMTTSSTITATQASTAAITNAINQLSANQTALMNQIATMTITNRAPMQPAQQYVPPIQQPPIQQQTIPHVQPFTGAATGDSKQETTVEEAEEDVAGRDKEEDVEEDEMNVPHSRTTREEPEVDADAEVEVLYHNHWARTY